MFFGPSSRIVSAVGFYILLDQIDAPSRARGNFSFRCFPMGKVSILALFSILREFVEKISVFANLYGHFVEKCSVFVALVFEGPLQSRPQDDVGDVALLMLLSTRSEFGEKTNVFLYRHGDLVEKCSAFAVLGVPSPLDNRAQGIPESLQNPFSRAHCRVDHRINPSNHF